MTQDQEQLIAIMRRVACGDGLRERLALTDPEKVYRLAKSQDVGHFVGYGVDKGLVEVFDPETEKAFQLEYLQAARRVMILENEIRNIRGVFETAGIDFIPLKGAVLRGLYPAPWMRVSGDIDVLVRAEDLARAEQTLVEKLRYTVTDQGAHHDHVSAPSGFHVDLHFTLTEREGAAKRLLDEVWDRCSPAEGKAHEHRMDDDMLYLFHMFHTAAHFQLGGCGLRPVLDTWLLNHRMAFDAEKRYALLGEAGLLTFARTLETLAEAWFSETAAEGLEDMEHYIFSGGLYGSSQRIAAAQAQNGNRLTYLVKRAFPPVRIMKHVGYPAVERWPVLLPLCWGHRLVRGLVQGKGKLIPYEFETTKQEADRSVEIARLFDRLGLR